MLSSKFIEAMNGALFVILSAVAVVFVRYLLREYRGGRGYGAARMQAAIAILVMASGDAVLRGWFWYWRALENAGRDVGWMWNWPLPIVGLVVQFVGAMCLIRVFSPDDWGRFAWALVALVACMVGLSVSFF